MGDNNAALRWAAGLNYGPVLSQIDLYLLRTDLELHPLLQHSHPEIHLIFNIATGQTGGFHPDARDREVPFTQKDEPATLPRVAQLIVISEWSPWCTVVKNEQGVTLGDLISALYQDYTTNHIQDAEIMAVPARLQEQIKRASQHNMSQMGPTGPSWAGFGGYTPGGRYRRLDWLREKVYFEGLRRNDSYASSRLGFSASNIFLMDIVS